MRAIFTHNIYYRTPKRELAFCGISKNAFYVMDIRPYVYEFIIPQFLCVVK